MTTSRAPVSVSHSFTIGIGPSRSHTVGAMNAASAFAKNLRRAGTADSVESARVEICGSLTATGHGHGMFTAVLLGLDGAQSARIDSAEVERRRADITASGTVSLGAGQRIPCRIEDFVFIVHDGDEERTSGVQLTSAPLPFRTAASCSLSATSQVPASAK